MDKETRTLLITISLALLASVSTISVAIGSSFYHTWRPWLSFMMMGMAVACRSVLSPATAIDPFMFREDGASARYQDMGDAVMTAGLVVAFTCLLPGAHADHIPVNLVYWNMLSLSCGSIALVTIISLLKEQVNTI